MSMLIKATNLSKNFESENHQVELFKNVSLSIVKGSSVSIMGISGSGKTTLLGILAGLDTPSSGEVFYEDTNLSKATDDYKSWLRSNKLAFVFQSFNLLDNLSVLENVMLPLELRGIDRAAAEKLAIECLDSLGLLNKKYLLPKTLSGGEQQRVGIARAYVGKPEILFADEPTGNLDYNTAEQVVDLLFNMNKKYQSTLILVTHDKKLAERCEQNFCLDNGVLREGFL